VRTGGKFKLQELALRDTKRMGFEPLAAEVGGFAMERLQLQNELRIGLRYPCW